MRSVSTPTELGAAVRDLRRARGWTQAELATAAGISRQLVIAIERGARPGVELSRVLSVLRALGKTLSITDSPVAPSLDDLIATVLRP